MKLYNSFECLKLKCWMNYNLSLDLFTFHCISLYSTSNPSKRLFLNKKQKNKVNSTKLKMFLRLLCWNILVLGFFPSSKKCRGTFSGNGNFWCYFVRTKIWVWICTQIRYTIIHCHKAGDTMSLDSKWFFIESEFP